MKKTNEKREEIKLIGITVRTNNAAESDWQKGVIFPCVQRYFQAQISEKTPNRKKPGTTYCAYTEYESDHTGDYTYFIGEEVNSLEDVPEGFKTLTIPSQHYAKFTTEPGAMPSVLKDAWQSIWEMTPEDFGGKRAYHTDFELYDERAQDHSNLVLDLYIGVEA